MSLFDIPASIKGSVQEETAALAAKLAEIEDREGVISEPCAPP